MKCLHLYLYFIDPEFGFGHLRLQTWFPFTIHVCINGREWLCRKLDRRKISYVRRENCVVAVEDIAAAQRILDAQAKADWQRLLNRLAKWAFPLHQRLLDGELMRIKRPFAPSVCCMVGLTTGIGRWSITLCARGVNQLQAGRDDDD